MSEKKLHKAECPTCKKVFEYADERILNRVFKSHITRMHTPGGSTSKENIARRALNKQKKEAKANNSPLPQIVDIDTLRSDNMMLLDLIQTVLMNMRQRSI